MPEGRSIFGDWILRGLCSDALRDLPATATDESATWEVRAEAALERLKKGVIEFCEDGSVIEFRTISRFPRYAQLVYEIVDMVNADIAADTPEHFTFYFKEPIIADYLREAVGEKP
jgi:hypothetical protein